MSEAVEQILVAFRCLSPDERSEEAAMILREVEVLEIPGALAYGNMREEAITLVQPLTIRVLADRLEHGEAVPEMKNVFTVVA